MSIVTEYEYQYEYEYRELHCIICHLHGITCFIKPV